MTRDQWKRWFEELEATHERWQVLDSIADMGEQVDILHRVRQEVMLNGPDRIERLAFADASNQEQRGDG